MTATDLAAFLAMSPVEIAAALGAGGGLENPIVALSRILAATRVTQRIARDLYDRNLPDLTAVYFEGTDEVGHVFAPYTPPRLACASDADVARYGRVVAAYYGVIDRMLGQWMRRAEEDGATLIVHSDHGFKWGEDRPCGLSSGNWSTAAFWHRLDGVFAAWGREASPVARRERGASSTSRRRSWRCSACRPTGGCRVPRSGRPFADLPAKPRSAALAGPRRAARLPPQAASAEEASEYAKKLLALGYLSPGEAQPLAPPGGDRPGMTEGAWNNLGLYLRDTAKKPAEAKAAFEKSLALRPDYYSPMFNLAVLYRAQGDTARAQDWLFRSLAALKADPATAVTGWAREYEKDGKRAAAAALLDRAARDYPGNEAIARDRALFLHRQKDCRGALAALTRFEAPTTSPEDPERSRALRDVPRAPGGGRATARALARARPEPAAGGAAARGRAAAGTSK